MKSAASNSAARNAFFAGMLLLSFTIFANSTFPASASAATKKAKQYAVIATSAGNIKIQLLPDDAPNTVANFLSYVKSNAYTKKMFIHRAVRNFVVQAGGYRLVNGGLFVVPAKAPVANEFKVLNTRGTLAMAKDNSADPDSATSQWFFNVKSNPTLNTLSGGYTVFAKVADAASLKVMDSIANGKTANLTTELGAAFADVPVRNYRNGARVGASNLIYVTSIKVVKAK